MKRLHAIWALLWSENFILLADSVDIGSIRPQMVEGYLTTLKKIAKDLSIFHKGMKDRGEL